MLALQGSPAWKAPSCRSDVALCRDRSQALLSSAPAALSQTRLHPCKMIYIPSTTTLQHPKVRHVRAYVLWCASTCSPTAGRILSSQPLCLSAGLPPLWGHDKQMPPPCRHTGTQPSSALWLITWLGNQQTKNFFSPLRLCCMHLLVTTPDVSMDSDRAGGLKKPQGVGLSEVPQGWGVSKRNTKHEGSLSGASRQNPHLQRLSSLPS